MRTEAVLSASLLCLLKEKLKAFQERLIEERKTRLEDRKRQRKEDRRNAYYREKEEEAQRIHEEQLKKGLYNHESVIQPVLIKLGQELIFHREPGRIFNFFFL